MTQAYLSPPGFVSCERRAVPCNELPTFVSLRRNPTLSSRLREEVRRPRHTSLQHWSTQVPTPSLGSPEAL